MRVLSSLAVAVLALVIVATPAVADHREDRDNESDRFGVERVRDCDLDVFNPGPFVRCVRERVEAEVESSLDDVDNLGLDEDCDNVGSLRACLAHSNSADNGGGVSAVVVSVVAVSGSDIDGDNDNEGIGD